MQQVGKLHHFRQCLLCISAYLAACVHILLLFSKGDTQGTNDDRRESNQSNASVTDEGL